MNKKKIYENYYLLSFVLGALAFYLFVSYSQMAGGKYIFLDGDNLDEYVPGYMALCDNIIKGKSIIYSWCIDLGMNSYINLSNSVLFNISTLLYLLLYKIDYATVTVIILIIKAGITALFFYLYIDKIWNIKGIRGLVFSVGYAMCAYMVVYIPAMLIYVDAIYMLPLILCLVSIFAKNGNYKLMCAAYLYVFLNFYYTGYIVGFFSFFYLVLYMIFINEYSFKIILKKIMFFGLCIIITAGITAIIIFPTIYFAFTKYSEDAGALTENMHVNPLDIYNQLFVGQVCGYNSNYYPYVYCGLPALLLFPLYFVTKKIKKKEKLFWGILLILMVISCFVLPLYLFWHCFDAPDGDPYRFSFIISLIICVIAARGSVYLSEFGGKILFFSALINSGIYILCMYIQPLYQQEYYIYPRNTWLYWIINSVFILGYFVWACLYSKYKEKYKNVMQMIIAIVVIAELVFNAYSGYYKEDYLVPRNNVDTYNLWQKTVNEALDEIKKDTNGFYRIGSKNDYILNAPLFFNYNGIASFASLENYEVRCVLDKLGLSTSARDIFCYGLTDFTRMILAVRYDINNVAFDNHSAYVVGSDYHADVIKNDYCLSLGFLVDESIKSFEFSGRNEFKNINELASCMTGREMELYELYQNNMELEEDGIVVEQVDEETFIFSMYNDDNNSAGLLHFRIPADNREAFVQFDYGFSVYDKDAPLLFDVTAGKIDVLENISVSYIRPLSRLYDKYEIAILMTDGLYKTVMAPQNINFAYYNKDEFLKLYNELKDGQMEVVDYDNGFVHGKVNVLNDDQILFTSIPYDIGWEVYVDGEKTQIIKLIDDAFIGIELKKGEHDIVFQYHVPGFNTGLIISIVSIILFVIFCMTINFIEHKNNSQNK